MRLITHLTLNPSSALIFFIKIYCFTIEKYSNAILEIIDQEFTLSKIKIILTKCNPPITGFDGKVSIVRILEKN